MDRMKVAVVTGSNAGLGYGIVTRLVLEHPDFHVVMACRSVEKAQAAKEKLIKEVQKSGPGKEKQDVGQRISVLKLDLADPRSVFRAARELHQRSHFHFHFHFHFPFYFLILLFDPLLILIYF